LYFVINRKFNPEFFTVPALTVGALAPGAYLVIPETGMFGIINLSVSVKYQLQSTPYY
jgi:hypothetical protein